MTKSVIYSYSCHLCCATNSILAPNTRADYIQTVPNWSTRRLMDLHHLISRICAFLLQLFPPALPFALQPVETLLCLVPGNVSAAGVAFPVRHPCSDFMDMLRCLTNCRFIIFIIIILTTYYGSGLK